MRLSRSIFLIDGTGAVLSTISLGYLLVIFEEYIGIPVHILYVLASIAGLFSVYSFTCHFIKIKTQSPYLRFIGIGNLLYSVTTLVLIILLWDKLKTLGMIYFIGEIMILWVLAYNEIKLSLKKKYIGED